MHKPKRLSLLKSKPNFMYWLENHKPLKNESAEDFAKRCMILLERGMEVPNLTLT